VGDTQGGPEQASTPVPAGEPGTSPVEPNPAKPNPAEPSAAESTATEPTTSEPTTTGAQVAGSTPPAGPRLQPVKPKVQTGRASVRPAPHLYGPEAAAERPPSPTAAQPGPPPAKPTPDEATPAAAPAKPTAAEPAPKPAPVEPAPVEPPTVEPAPRLTPEPQLTPVDKLPSIPARARVAPVPPSPTSPAPPPAPPSAPPASAPVPPATPPATSAPSPSGSWFDPPASKPAPPPSTEARQTPSSEEPTPPSGLSVPPRAVPSRVTPPRATPPRAMPPGAPEVGRTPPSEEPTPPSGLHMPPAGPVQSFGGALPPLPSRTPPSAPYRATASPVRPHPARPGPFPPAARALPAAPSRPLPELPPAPALPAAPARPATPSESAPPAVPAGPGHRRLWLGLLTVVAVLVVAAVGLVVIRPGGLLHSGTAASAPASHSATPAAPPSPVLAAAGTDAPVPSEADVAAALRGPLSDGRLGGHVSVRVVDVATGKQLFAQNDTDPSTPASTMKLATASAVLALRGPAYQLTTRVVAGANPGEVVIIGGGDPTLAINGTGSYPGAARLDSLADQVRRALGGTAPTKVIVDSSLFSGPNTGPDWESSDVDNGGQASRISALMTDGGRITPTKVAPPSPRYPRPDLAAGQAFARLLGVPTSQVGSGTAPPAPADPLAASPGDASATAAASALAPGTQLGAVKSAPLLNIVEQMLANSDNTVAEMMARQVALARNQPATFAGGATAVLDELNELGLPTGGLKIVDGSGLSPDDRLTTRLLTAILTLVARADHPQLHGVLSGLPVAGYSGTLASRFRTPTPNPADGEVRAKTGTLTGVHALAGYVPDAKGRLLAFAVLVDRVTAPLLPAEDAVDQIGTALTKVS
jgi:serine-type D-Ala-D-Ala carboxypeptidase/endopeptidase (penicillin-binding protein 4)